MDDITEGKIKRLRNLNYYAGKTDEEIVEMLKDRTVTVKTTKSERHYQERFDDKLKILQQEFGLDMNSSNDVEMVNNLIRQMLQSENVDRDILNIQDKESKNKEDISTLKALGDFQRDIQITVSDLQDKLGISRKVRKEKQIDDIPQFIDGVLLKAKEFWQRKTVPVECPKCNIELLRYWLNFPEDTISTAFLGTCPQCGEKVKYNA